MRANHLPELVIKRCIISHTSKLIVSQVCKHASESSLQNICNNQKSAALSGQKTNWQQNSAIAIQPLPSREPFLIGAEAIFKWPLISGRLTTIGLSVPPSPIPIQPPKAARPHQSERRRGALLTSLPIGGAAQVSENMLLGRLRVRTHAADHHGGFKWANI